MENDVKDITNELYSNKEVLTALKSSMIDNITIMQTNVDSINNKLHNTTTTINDNI